MKDYSQFGEQDFILHACEGADSKRFLDIGSWNPFTFSNTRALYELGWDGVMIEPSPGPMRALVAEYGNEPRITLVQSAMAWTPSLLSMHITDDSVSTSEPAEFEKWRGVAHFNGTILVPTITWEDVNNRFGGFAFVNIDAEGQSVNLFLRMLALKTYPRCVCLEHESRLEEIMCAATPLKYSAVCVNGTNAVLTR